MCNTPGANARAVAEQTIGLLFAVKHKLVTADHHVRSGGWERHEFITNELDNNILGIYGIGNIGSVVAGFASALGLNVVAYDPYVDPIDVANHVKLVTIKENFFRSADIVSIHAPLTKETRKSIGSEEFDKMPDHGIIMNTARGDIFDEKDLIKSLNSGAISGAGLDVISN